ncbi:MAG: DUF721 domain-containing protein [Bacteroidota bacterium]
MSFRKTPHTLNALLPGVIKKMGIQGKLDEARAVEAWATIAGLRINRTTERVWMRGTTLHVKVTSSAWRHALHQQRGLWVKRLNEQLAEEQGSMQSPKVKEIRFC